MRNFLGNPIFINYSVTIKITLAEALQKISNVNVPTTVIKGN